MNTEAIQNQVNTTSTALPVLPPNPGDPPDLVKILLSQAASDALKAVGTCLCVTEYAPYPCPQEVMGRQVLICSPITTKMLNDIYLVLEGRATIKRIRQPKPTSHA